MIRHGSVSPCTRTAALRVTTPYAPFPKRVDTNACPGHFFVAVIRMADRLDDPSASSRIIPATDHAILKIKVPQATA
jgi:hypothetical protein